MYSYVWLCWALPPTGDRVPLWQKRRQAEASRSIWIQLSILHTDPLVYKQQLSSYLLITDSTPASPLTITISKVYLYYFIICMILLQTNFYIEICCKDCWINTLGTLSMTILVLHKTSFHNNPIKSFPTTHSEMEQRKDSITNYINSLEFPKLGSQISGWLPNWNST